MRASRKSVENLVRAFYAKDPVFLDTETTGLGISDEVVDVAIVDLAGQTLFQSLVKPGKKIPRDAIAVHGITDAMVRQAPSWQEVWPQILAVTGGRHLGIYNKQFDIRLMRQTCLLHGIAWKPPATEAFCVMEMFAEYYGEWNRYHRSYTWQKLEAAGQYFRLSYPNSHRAKDDALLAKEVFLAMGVFTTAP